MNCFAELKSLSAILDQRKPFAKANVTLSRVTMAPVSMTVETTGLSARLPKRFLKIFLTAIYFSSYIISGMTFAATMARRTSKAECLKPAAKDSSLILPATNPIR